MRSVDLENKFRLLPDVYTKRDGSNNRKKWQMIAKIFEDVNTVFGQLEGLEDLKNVYGATLDFIGLNVGLMRNGLSDDQFRALIFAKRAVQIGGNSVNRILQFLSFYVGPGKLHLIELWDVFTTYFLDATRPLDGTWNLSSIVIGYYLDNTRILDASWLLSGIPMHNYRGFYIQATGLSPSDQAILSSVLPNLRAAGVYGVINA